MSTVEYIKQRIGSSFSLRPELGFQQRIVRTLLALLKIRRLENYFMQGCLLVRALQELIEQEVGKKMGGEREEVDFIVWHKIQEVALSFEGLTDEESDGIKKYFEGLLSNQEEEASLERHINRVLGVESRELFNPDRFKLSMQKLEMATLAVFSSGDRESFVVRVDNQSASIRDVIRAAKEFFRRREFRIEEPYFGPGFRAIDKWGGVVAVCITAKTACRGCDVEISVSQITYP